MWQSIIGELRSDVNIEPKLKLVTAYNKVFVCNYYEKVMNVAFLLFLLNLNSCDSQVKVFNIFIRVVKICIYTQFSYELETSLNCEKCYEFVCIYKFIVKIYFILNDIYLPL